MVIAVTEKATLWSDRKKKGDDKGALFPYTEGRFLPQCFFLLSLIFCFFVLGGYKGGLFLPLSSVLSFPKSSIGNLNILNTMDP